MVPGNILVWTMLLLFAATPAPAGPGSVQTVEITYGKFGYVISVPEKWREGASGDDPSIKLHLVDPEGMVKGHFTVQVLPRHGRSLDAWAAHHLEHNFPRVHGECIIESKEYVAAGSYDGMMIHATDLELHDRYNLCETLLATDSHVITLSYLHGHDPEAAGEKVGRILSSFHTRTMSDYCGSTYYEEGRALGLEDFGLFLRLPRSWIPGEKTGEEIPVRLPQGRMTVYTFKRVSRGIEELMKLVHDNIPRFKAAEIPEITTFGREYQEAFHAHLPGSGESSGLDAYLGLHGRGGYALVLASDSEEERAAFRRVAAEAILLEPSKVKSRFQSEMRKLKKVLRTKDRAGLCPPLTLLSLFSDSKSAAFLIAEGLESQDPVIQSECARALGRMDCEVAGRTVKTALLEEGSGLELKEACIRALGMIGGLREKEFLVEFRRKTAGSDDARYLLPLLDRTIAGFAFAE